MDFKLPICSKCGKLITGKFTVCFGEVLCLNCMSFVTVYDLVADDKLPLYPDVIEINDVEVAENSDGGEKTA